MNCFAKGMLLAGLLVGLVFASAEVSHPPNIVVLLADDLGYGDLGVHGAKDVQTPRIDALFRGGLQFGEAYVSYSACGPSRASIMTGRHHMRLGFPFNPDHAIPTQPGNRVGLPEGEITLADLLRKQGYATGLFGKWHLGFQPQNHPLNRGFDEFHGFLGSLYRYFDLGNMPLPYCMEHGFEKVHEKAYLTDAFAREGANFITRHRNEPFFLLVAFNAVHTPLMLDTPPPPDRDIPLDGTGNLAENRRMLVNMIQGLDRGVGTVMDQLANEGLLENTLVFFLSDNGGPEATGVYNNGNLRGWKAQQYEGGIRVPMAAYWKGRIAPGRAYGFPVLATDIFATAVGLAGGRLPGDREYDSKNLAPVLLGKTKAPLHAGEALCWTGHNMQAIRRDDWKLVMQGGKPVGLYNIPADAGEQNNLLAAYPERVERLRRDFKAWRAAMPEPVFKHATPKEIQTWEKEHGKLW